MNNDIKHLPNGDFEVAYDTPVYIGVDLAQGNNKTVTSWVGYCQRCGMLDHHLEHELCPLCLKITPMHEEVDESLGAEAYVSHVVDDLQAGGCS